MMTKAHCLGKSVGVTFANEMAISFQQKGWFLNLTVTVMTWCTVHNFEHMYEKVY